MNLRQKAKKYKKRCKELEDMNNPRVRQNFFDRRCVNMLPFKAKIAPPFFMPKEEAEGQIRKELTDCIIAELRKELPERIIITEITEQESPFTGFPVYEATVYIGFN